MQVNYQELIDRLLSQHNTVIDKALMLNGKDGTNVLPQSIHDYTNMFLCRVKDIISEINKCK